MEYIIMNHKEREQLIMFEKIKNKEISKAEAALQLGMTQRWIRKKYKRYVSNGASGLTHQSRNRISAKRWDNKEKDRAIELLQSKWQGFGPTFATEKLKEIESISVSRETLRKVMIQAGIWEANKKRLRHRKRRERRAMIGLLIQLDGSPHDWFEGRGPRCVLLVFVDDATSSIGWLEFVPSESQIGVITATKNYMLAHGRPHAFYVDFGSVFSVNTNNPERDKKTQWESIMSELLVTVHHAQSPQAKGRVERANGTLQDRLVKEMRLAGVSSIDEANAFLRTSDFIKTHNQKFAVSPTQEGDAHRSIQIYNVDEVFCLQEKRVLANDYTISFNKRLFQITHQQKAVIRPKDHVVVRTYLDESIALFIRKTKLNFTEIFSRPQRKNDAKIIKKIRLNKVHPNSRRWASGLL